MRATCPICSKQDAPAAPARTPRVPRSRTGPARTPRASSGVRLRQLTRAPDDGYDHPLVPGLRATADAARLAHELAFAIARLEELAQDPPGLYAEAAAATDPEEGVWLAFLIAYVGPGRGSDPWSEIEAARVPWATGEPPALDGLQGGPRSALVAARAPRTIEAYRAWAQRAGGQLPALRGEADWEPARRFARTFERLAMPGLGRAPRFDLLVTLGALGLLEAQAGALFVGADALDPVVSAAKRVLGIGDAINLERRAAELARGVGVPIAALDLALSNFARPEQERATMGARRGADDGRRRAIRAALGAA